MTGLLGLPVARHGAVGGADHVLPQVGVGRAADAELAQLVVVPRALLTSGLVPGFKTMLEQFHF